MHPRPHTRIPDDRQNQEHVVPSAALTDCRAPDTGYPPYRYLDEIEISMLGIALSHACEYLGYVDDYILHEAYQTLSATHPVLCATVKNDGFGYRLAMGNESALEFLSVRGDMPTLLRHLRSHRKPAEGLTSLIHVRGRQGGFVALQMDHSIMDGPSFRKIFEDLWASYTNLSYGREPVVPTIGIFPQPPTAVFDRYSDQIGALAGRLRATKAPNSSVHSVEPIQGHLRFSHADTQQLLQAARTVSTTVNSLLCGAIVVAQRRLMSNPSTLTAMTCISHVGLRTRVNPPVPATATSNFVGMHVGHVTASHNSDPVAVGKELRAQLDHAQTYGDFHAIGTPQNRVELVEDQEGAAFSTTMVSNNATIHSTLSVPPSIKIVEIYIPVSQMSANYPGFSAFTFRGRLSIRYLYPSNIYNDATSEAMTDNIRGLIYSASRNYKYRTDTHGAS